MSVLSNHNTYRNQQSNFFKILTLARNEVLYHSQKKDVTLDTAQKEEDATRIKSEKTVLHLRLFEETSLLIFHVCTSSHSFADFPKCRKEGAHCTSLVLTRRKKKFLLFVLPRRLSKGVSFRSVAVLKH